MLESSLILADKDPLPFTTRKAREDDMTPEESGIQVFFVDDNEDFLSTCKILYSKDGRVILTAATSQEAIWLVENLKGPGIGFIDEHLGLDMTGRTLVRYLKKFARHPLRCIGYSADDSQAMQVQMRDAGFDACLSKLSTPDLVESTIRSEVRTISEILNSPKDSMTGLDAKWRFKEEVLKQVERTMRAREHRRGTKSPDLNTAILFLDLDKLGPINKTWGQHVGDQVIMAAAEEIKAEFRRYESIGRLGGDEFGVMIVNTTPKMVETVQMRLVNAIQLREVDKGDGTKLPVRITSGCLMLTSDLVDEDPEVTWKNILDTASLRMSAKKSQIVPLVTEDGE